MENCKFKVFNFKENRYVPCEIIRKIDNRIFKVKEYIKNIDGSITIIETCTFVNNINNI